MPVACRRFLSGRLRPRCRSESIGRTRNESRTRRPTRREVDHEREETYEQDKKNTNKRSTNSRTSCDRSSRTRATGHNGQAQGGRATKAPAGNASASNGSADNASAINASTGNGSPSSEQTSAVPGEEWTPERLAWLRAWQVEQITEYDNGTLLPEREAELDEIYPAWRGDLNRFNLGLVEDWSIERMQGFLGSLIDGYDAGTITFAEEFTMDRVMPDWRSDAVRIWCGQIPVDW